jgi:hypothetical protein
MSNKEKELQLIAYDKHVSSAINGAISSGFLRNIDDAEEATTVLAGMAHEIAVKALRNRKVFKENLQPLTRRVV